MKGKISYVSPNGVPVPTAELAGASAIADWLGSDIQYSEYMIDEWLKVLNDVALGERDPGYQGTGNSHSVMVINDWVFIECEYIDEQKVLLTRQQVTAALEEYRLFLKCNYKSSEFSPNSFWVEYEAEGQEAFDRYIATGGSLGVNTDT